MTPTSQQPAKNLEELAKIGWDAHNSQFAPNTYEKWDTLPEYTKRGCIAQTLAIIREVLEPVSKEESVIPSRSVADANFLLQCRRYHYMRTAKEDCNPTPQNVQLPLAIETNVAISDDEVERVAGAMYESTNPSKFQYASHVSRETYLKEARAAIAAMGGAKRWGVWAMPEGFASKGAFVEVGVCGSKSTTDKALCESVVDFYRRNGDAAVLSVREYTPPAAEIPKEAIAEFKKAFDFYACDGHDRAVEMGLTAAVPHLKGGE